MSAIDDFRSKLAVVEHFDFVYVVLPKQGIRKKLSGSRVSDNKMATNTRKSPLFCTSDKSKKMFLTVKHMASLWPEVIPDFQINGNAWPKGFYTSSNFQGDTAFYQKLKTLKSANDSMKIVVQYYCISPDDNFIGLFFVMHQGSELTESLRESINQPWVAALLELTHFYMTRKYPSLTNPNLYNGSIREKTLKILEHTAAGMNYRDIGEELHLTERGVHYHIDRAKLLLNATNKADLVRIAKECCLI